MTTIAGYVGKKKITLAADSRTSLGSMRIDHTLKRSKLFRGSDVIVASTGLASESSLLTLFAKDHSVGETGGDLRILEWLMEFSNWKGQKTQDSKIENNYIIGHSSGLYSTVGLSVFPIKEYTAHGCGQHYALTAMYLGKTVEEAVEVACDLDSHTDRPVKTLSILLKDKND